jgi:SAM-dependent methyltransferase
MTDTGASVPSPFISRWVPRLAAWFGRRGAALDFACGTGRHARLLAGAGFDVLAIDRNVDALRDLRRVSAASPWRIALLAADLTTYVPPRRRYQVVVVTRYLDRARFATIVEALAPGGVLLYETFTTHQLRYDRGPRSPEHLLAPGELRLLTAGMDMLFDEEVTAPDAVARVAVRRR